MLVVADFIGVRLVAEYAGVLSGGPIRELVMAKNVVVANRVLLPDVLVSLREVAETGLELRYICYDPALLSKEAYVGHRFYFSSS